MCEAAGGASPPYIAFSDVSVPLLGITCTRLPDFIREQNGVGLARLVRLITRLIEDL